ncbi:MAG: chemotaxis protein CheW [Planctomycetales bacterium]|nr:chemotaxis protein CheW [Planctomycetales bacterium]
MTVITSTPTSTNASTSQFVTFYLGDLLLGLPIHQVQEINRHLEVTSVPQSNASLRGVINLRGDVVSVINLSTILGINNSEFSAESRNVIIHHEGELIGLMVDSIADILSIDQSDVVPPPANVNGVDGRFFRGVYTTQTQLVVLLDLCETIG